MEPSNHARPDAASVGDGSNETVDRVWPPGWHVESVAETASTNADLLAAAAAGARDRSVLAAEHQTQGRGRLDRRWDAPPGSNLLVSLLFREVDRDAQEFTRRVGVAAVAAAHRHGTPDARLKWPNDVVVDGRKLAGVLAQQATDGSIVVGIGLNVGWAPDGATRLGDGIAPLDVLASLLVAYDDLPADVHSRYCDLLDTIGRRVRVDTPAGPLTGTALDVGRDGRLHVLDAGAVTHRVVAGDVVHLRTID